MLDLKSDIGKVALGGAIAVAGQLAVTLIAWLKDAQFAARKKRKDAEYLALRLVLVFDGVVNACYSAVHDPLREDQEGISESTVPDPTITLPSDGDYKALPRDLMYDVLSMPNRLDGIKEGLAATAEDSFPPDYPEYYAYRCEHWSRFGLKALDLIDALCRLYKIPQPERPDHYTPEEAFKNELANVENYQKERDKQNAAMTAHLTSIRSDPPS